MSKRKSNGSSVDEFSQSSGNKRRASAGAAAIEPIKLPRLSFITELEDKYISLTRKALTAAEKAAKGSSSSGSSEQLQQVFESIKTSAFDCLRANCIQVDVADDDDMEELDRDLAREVDRLRKTEGKLAKAVKEAREKNRALLPGQLKAAYEARLASLIGEDEEEEEENWLEEEESGAGASVTFLSSPRSSIGGKSKGKGRKSMAPLMGSPTVAVAAAGLKEQLKVLRDAAADVSERATSGRRVVGRATKDVTDMLAVQAKAGKKTHTDEVIASAAGVPTPGKRAPTPGKRGPDATPGTAGSKRK